MHVGCARRTFVRTRTRAPVALRRMQTCAVWKQVHLRMLLRNLSPFIIFTDSHALRVRCRIYPPETCALLALQTRLFHPLCVSVRRS